ncbi:MAG: hypothetical protein ACYDB9_04790, partial [Gammaproteobacteria bacterium]
MPGIDSDARWFSFKLERQHITRSASIYAERTQYEREAKQAMQQRVWSKAVNALSIRLGLGDSLKPRLWLELAMAKSNLPSPDWRGISSAAYIAYEDNLKKRVDPH